MATRESLLAALLRLSTRLSSEIDATSGLEEETKGWLVTELMKLKQRLANHLGDVNEVVASLERAAALFESAYAAVPLKDCVTILLHISTAISAFVAAADPLPTGRISLPVELLALVVERCQFDDHEQRQRTNMSLALVSRAMNTLVRPILRREIHCWTPRQFERAAVRLQDGTDWFGKQLACLSLRIDTGAVVARK
ncbi:hypothetical protein JCM10213_002055 [Rhodosporidiobolus nylandii]